MFQQWRFICACWLNVSYLLPIYRSSIEVFLAFESYVEFVPILFFFFSHSSAIEVCNGSTFLDLIVNQIEVSSWLFVLCSYRSLVMAFKCTTFLIFVVSELQVWMQCSFASYEHNQNKWWLGEGKLSLSSPIESLPLDNTRICSLYPL